MPELTFKGKSLVQNYHLSIKYHQLVPRKKKSLGRGVSLDDNLIIHGDNLKALKALLPTYAGRIKCIYIDPPYNTGNEKWVYNDNVNSPMMQDWLGKVVDRDDLTRHDKWLCMMTPRLKLLKELLRDDGVIFISIDENEQHHLRSILDEVFGEQNQIGTFVWASRGGQGGTTEQIECNHEYVECFCKNSASVELKRITRQKEDGKYSDESGMYDREKLTQWGQGDRREDRPTMYFSITAPDGTKVYPQNTDELGNNYEARWRFGRKTIEKMLADGDIDFTRHESGKWSLYRKIRSGRISSTASLSLLLDCGTSANGTAEIKALFGSKVFNTPKPSALIQHLIELSTDEDPNAIILDSFAGSGTTAHAVLSLNKRDGGNRRFILIECEDYADRITAERVRRVIRGVPGSKKKEVREGLGGTFSYFDLGKALEIGNLLSGKDMPDFTELARYVFYTATGEEFDEKKVDPDKYFIGSSKNYRVYMIYRPDVEFLKSSALTLERAKSLGRPNGKRRLVFAPAQYLGSEKMRELNISFSQLPFEIYRMAK